MRSLTAIAIVSVSLAVNPALSCGQDGPTGAAAETLVPATLQKARRPIYPQDYFSRGYEGWVVLSAIVSENGEVIEPMIEDSSGGRLFEERALEAVRGWTYEPATIDGEPVEQAVSNIRVVFKQAHSPRGVRRDFKQTYDEILELIGEHEFEEAARLRASEAARRSSAYPEVLGEMEHHLERVLAVINGEDVLVINARIGEHGYWVHDLMRRSFSLEEIAGRLELVDIRCSHGTRRDAAISEGRIWKVPRDWGQCGVYIKGSEGASFNLYEHADTEGVRYTIQPKREMQYACVQVAFRKFRTVCQDHPNSKNVLR